MKQNNNMSVCLFPGKFHPFHNGQLMVVKGMAKVCGKLKLIVCCGDEDPLFTEDEVREMLSATLLEEDLLDAEIHVLNNCMEDEEWVDRLVEFGEGQEVQVWSGNEDVLALCESQGVNTKKIVHVPGHDSEEIADWIRTGAKEWQAKVPKGVANVVRGKFQQ